MDFITNGYVIERRVQRQFLERIGQRLKLMRRDLVDRNWPALRVHCKHLQAGGAQYGYGRIAERAQAAEFLIPDRPLSRATALPHAHAALGELLQAIEEALMAEPSSQIGAVQKPVS